MIFIKILNTIIQLKKQNIFIIFYGMIPDMLSNKNFNRIVTELFVRRRKLKISLTFISQFYLAVPKDIMLNSTHYFVMKIPNIREHEHIAYNHSLDINSKDFMNLCKKCTAKPYSLLVIDATLTSGNPLYFRKNLVQRIQKLIMTIDDKIRDKKLQYNISREAEKISTLSSGKIDKYEYVTGPF